MYADPIERVGRVRRGPVPSSMTYEPMAREIVEAVGEPCLGCKGRDSKIVFTS